ncbi:MAG: class I SAM-dependent methyltransferase [Chloroflexi bacterium]|nr:class I SAM-dependent methyltransferase [Chloroflexota bacterium]
MKLTPHTEEWYAWLSKQQKGYFYPGCRVVAPWHGEDNFRTLVFEHLQPEMDVLEVACAQGNLALAMAPHVRSVLAYDVTPDYIDMTCKAAEERGITNVKFLVHNSRAQFNDGRTRLPAEDHSVDLWVNSKGPFHSILDAPRVCRPGAVMLMLVPSGGVPSGGRSAPWSELLPETLRSLLPPDQDNPNWAYKAIVGNLNEAGLRLHSWWDFDVPEYLPNPRELYIGLTWPFMEDEVPPYQEVEPALERIFKEFAGPQGLENRWRRSIWKAVIPG